MTNELWWKDFFRGAWEEVQLPHYPEQRTSADFVIDALQLRGGARILDVPCGEGRHAIELRRRNFDVTGIDFNENAIAVAKQHATEAKLDASFLAADMRKLAVVEEYDAVICFSGSFGYFSDDNNFEFLRRVARALRPGGSFLLDGHVTESLYPKFRERDWSWIREEPPLRVLEERKMDIEEGRVET